MSDAPERIYLEGWQFEWHKNGEPIEVYYTGIEPAGVQVCVEYIRADLATVPQGIRDWVRNTLAENHYNLLGGDRLDYEGQQVQDWLDSLAEQEAT